MPVRQTEMSNIDAKCGQDSNIILKIYAFSSEKNDTAILQIPFKPSLIGLETV